jgi:mycothiol synthase
MLPLFYVACREMEGRFISVSWPDPKGYISAERLLRDFATGADEELWCGMRNASYSDWPNFTPSTLEEMRAWERAPSFDAAGMLFAEDGGAAVGILDAHVDPMREERKGFLYFFAVVPARRRQGLGRQMLARALESFSARGIESVETWIWDGAAPARAFAESAGFRPARASSLMGRPLSLADPEQREIPGLSIKRSPKTRVDVELLNRLDNESFREHYNYRPVSVEETRWRLFVDNMVKPVDIFFAEVDGAPVGYTVVGTDKAWLEEKGERRGWLLDLGVLKPYRGRGIGSALVRQALEEMRARGLDEAVLGVDEMNQTGALRIYERFGFGVKSRNVAYLLQIGGGGK